MKLKATITVLMFISVFGLCAQTPSLQWVKSLGGAALGGVVANQITLDSKKNIYTTGHFTFNQDFNPGSATATLSSLGSNDIFVSKLDASGNYKWAKRVGSTDDDRGRSISTDAAGNVYVTGYFQGTVDFDPGVGVFNLNTSANFVDHMFVLKLDSNGNFVWARRMGGTLTSDAERIVVDAIGNSYITGNFNGVTDFDPNPMVVTNVTTTGLQDIFIVKLDASGNLVWYKTFGSTSLDYGKDIVLDANGDLYLVGQFTNVIDFDAGPNVFNLGGSSQTSCLILKMNGAGNFIWGRAFKSPTSGGFCGGEGITLDANNNIYTTGLFSGTIDFDPNGGTSALSSSGSFQDVFISKLDANGNYLWAKSITSNFQLDPKGIATDTQGNAYTVGYFSGTTNFNPNGTNNITPVGNTDIYIHQLTSSGAYVSTKTIGGPNNDVANDLFIDQSDRFFMTGYYSGTVDFDPDAGVVNLISTNASAYVFNYGVSVLGLEKTTLNYRDVFSIYPNPNTGKFNLKLNQFDNNQRIEIYNTLGVKVYEQVVDRQTSLFDLNLQKGLYSIYLINDLNYSTAQKLLID
jgi:hypothetical protein